METTLQDTLQFADLFGSMVAFVEDKDIEYDLPTSMEISTFLAAVAFLKDIDDDKALFDQLFNNKDEIESKIGFSLIWDRLDGKKAARIKSKIPGLNFDDKSNYPELMDKAIDRAVLIRDVFKLYI